MARQRPWGGGKRGRRDGHRGGAPGAGRAGLGKCTLSLAARTSLLFWLRMGAIFPGLIYRPGSSVFPFAVGDVGKHGMKVPNCVGFRVWGWVGFVTRKGHGWFEKLPDKYEFKPL
jgi:hypothetical protein